MHWLIYGGLVWVALVGFFWCVLAMAARADRRDARTGQRNGPGAASTAPPSAGRFARARGRLRRGARGALNARPDPDQALPAARDIEAISLRGLGDPPRDRDGA
jgi:hypothetical protein